MAESWVHGEGRGGKNVVVAKSPESRIASEAHPSRLSVSQSVGPDSLPPSMDGVLVSACTRLTRHRGRSVVRREAPTFKSK